MENMSMEQLFGAKVEMGKVRNEELINEIHQQLENTELVNEFESKLGELNLFDIVKSNVEECIYNKGIYSLTNISKDKEGNGILNLMEDKELDEILSCNKTLKDVLENLLMDGGITGNSNVYFYTFMDYVIGNENNNLSKSINEVFEKLMSSKLGQYSMDDIWDSMMKNDAQMYKIMIDYKNGRCLPENIDTIVDLVDWDRVKKNLRK